MLETYEIMVAIMEAMDMTRISLFFTCAISCAITPSNSSSLRRLRSPLVATTAASLGLRPVANALGTGDSTIPTSGMGTFARFATFLTVEYRRGSSYSLMMRARFAFNAIFLQLK